uniref:2-aminoethanethiol dioxygenase isoform X1 n=1 Tax=Myxine glutinosa TaxID=7769 RepID=UPI00358EC98D
MQDVMAVRRLQAVARQASSTFRGSARRLSPSSTSLSTLRELLGSVCAADLRISEPATRSTKRSAPPVTYMNIYDDEDFSLGVFLLKPNSTIPLHDHPGMYGFMKVLYGRLCVTSYDPKEKCGTSQRATLAGRVELESFHQPCVLTPEKGNIHEVSAAFGPAAFLDILAPPYDDEAGRPCHYYRACTSPDGVSWDRDERSESPDWWLMEIPQPSTFWCGGQAYVGPHVTL